MILYIMFVELDIRISYMHNLIKHQPYIYKHVIYLKELGSLNWSTLTAGYRTAGRIPLASRYLKVFAKVDAVNLLLTSIKSAIPAIRQSLIRCMIQHVH